MDQGDVFFLVVALVAVLGVIASAVSLILVTIQWASYLIAAWGTLPVAIGACVGFVGFGLLALIVGIEVFE